MQLSPSVNENHTMKNSGHMELSQFFGGSKLAGALGLLSLSLLFLGCPLERLDPGAVGQGIAQLTSRDVATLTSVVNTNTACGFANSKVATAGVASGVAGTEGTVTWRVDGCEVDFQKSTELSTDCTGTTVTAGGRVILSATKTVSGMLTGDPENPVIPLTPDAVRIEARAQTLGFWVKRSSSPSSLKHQGGVSWTAMPHLAVGSKSGVCSVATNELTISEVKLEKGQVIVDLGDHSFTADVDSSAINAQFGRWGSKENSIDGSIKVWGESIKLPAKKDKPGLDPDYNAGKFIAAYSCNPDLQSPLTFTCPSMAERLGLSAARLSVSAFATMASYLDENPTCGFGSPSVLANAQLTGTVGVPGGTAVFTIAQPCEVYLGPETAVKTDCQNVSRLAQGKVSLTGTKTVTGVLTGDPALPIIPNSRNPAVVNATLRFQDFRLTDSKRTSELRVTSGALSGVLRPTVAIDTTTGVCSKKTPVVETAQLQWNDGKLVVKSGASSFGVNVTTSNVVAQAGSKDNRTNFIAGTLTVNGAQVTLPTDTPVLDPSFNASTFDSTYTCDTALRIATVEEDCNLTKPLLEFAARLLVQNAGSIASVLNKDKECGFSKTWVQMWPTEVVGEVGQMGSMSWAIEDCELATTEPSQLDENCSGAKRFFTGKLNASAARTVSGERSTKKILYGIVDTGINTVIPRSADALTMQLQSVDLTEFSAYSIPAGAAIPTARLIIHQGKLRGNLQPYLGENKNEVEGFNIPTPVATFKDLSLINARTTVQIGNLKFLLDIPELHITAQSGSVKGVRNTLSGVAVHSGKTITLSSMALDPNYDQGIFDRSYSCNPELKAVLPAQ